MCHRAFIAAALAIGIISGILGAADKAAYAQNAAPAALPSAVSAEAAPFAPAAPLPHASNAEAAPQASMPAHKAQPEAAISASPAKIIAETPADAAAPLPAAHAVEAAPAAPLSAAASPASAPSARAAEAAPAANLPAANAEAAPLAAAPRSTAAFSPAAMFWQADWVVKAVMLGLLLLSALSWSIFIIESLTMAAAKRHAAAALKTVLRAPSLNAARNAAAQKSFGAMLIEAAAAEVELSQAALPAAGHAGLKERLASALASLIAAAGRGRAKNMAIVATIGSVAPFIGLFGTVWGIMNAFIGVAAAQNASLAVVAPGIAEALLATAVGLFAAIPATVIYNVFVASVSRYKNILADIAAGLERLVSRDLDFAAANFAAAAPLPAENWPKAKNIAAAEG